MSMPRYRPPRWPTANFLGRRKVPTSRQPTLLGQQALDTLRELQQRQARVPVVGERLAQEAENYMKANRPWKDRTTEARKRLKVEFINLGGTYVLRFSHGVYYGRFLEYRWGGRYSILRPAAAIFTERLRDRLRYLFKRSRGAFSLRQVIDTTSAFNPKTGGDFVHSSIWGPSGRAGRRTQLDEGDE